MLHRLTGPDELVRLREQLQRQRDPSKPCLAICAGTGCQAYGVGRVIGAFEQELEKQGLANQVNVLATGCPGFCERGPLVVVRPEGIFYQRVQVKDVPDIVQETIVNGQVIERLLYDDPLSYMRQLSRLASDPDLAALLGRTGRTFVEGWTWDAAAARWSDLLDQVASSSNR